MVVKKLIKSLIESAIADSEFDVSLYHQVVPQAKQFPAIIYKQISGNQEYCKGGTAVTEVRIQVDVFHKDDVQCAGIAQVIHTAVNLFIGDYEGVNFQYVVVGNKNENYEHDLNLHRITQDFIFRHS